MKIFNLTRLAMAMLLGAITAPLASAAGEEVPVFITIGQSNADGSAMFDANEDARLQTWYASDENQGNLKIWYRSTYVQNQTANALGEAARWVFDGTTTDVQPGWLNLWYRNENTAGRTAMNMIHNYGTWSTGSGTDCAQGRRGMEGEFGMKFAQAFPDQELYIIKLGVSGSFISSWANTADDHNWDYFYENMFKPAIADLISRGKRPRLAGVWWMQGCADRAQDQAYYEKALRNLIKKCRQDLGFIDGKVYVGGIIKPGESISLPTASSQFGQGVRDAQMAVVATVDGVEFIDTHSASMQYESNLGGYVHFDHKGVNAIGDMIAEKVIADGKDGWAEYTTPGQWNCSGTTATFTPAVGNPTIAYSQDGDVVTATLTYPGWTETKTYTVNNAAAGPGYLDCDGTRYMTIPHSSDFDIAAGGSMTVTAKVWLDTYGAHRGIINNRYHAQTSNTTTSGFDIFGGNSATESMSNNINLNKGSWNNLGHVWCNTLGTGQWQWITWVYNGSAGNSKIYLDGVLKDTRTNNDIKSYPINPQCDMLVGARYVTTNGVLATVDMGSCWKGKITDVRFYNRALSDSEVVAEMSSSVGPETNGLFAAYNFNDINGLTVKDITGNGHDGTLVGFPEYVVGSTITVTEPENGSITLYNGGDVVVSGQNVEDGTLINITATPAANYLLKEIKVNGVAISGSSFVVNGSTTVSATFERDPSAPLKTVVFDMYESGSKYYRIPAIETAADGSIIAVADKRGASNSDLPNTISVVAKRSTDGGQTWSNAVTIAEGNSSTGKTYGDPAIVLDKTTGNLVCVFAGDTGFFVSTKTSRAGFYVSISSDNGLTWSAPRSITDQIYQSSWYGAFAASGSLLQTESGRLMFVANTRLSSAQYVTQVYEFVCVSDDGGQTWSVINNNSRVPSDGQGNESKLVECSDGSLIMSIRSSGHRRLSRSTDGGVTWSDAVSNNDLPEPSCNGDIIAYPSLDGQSRLLHTLPADASARNDVTVFLSYDDGQTWPVSRLLVEGSSAYSSLTVLPDGRIGCLTEEGVAGEDGYRLSFYSFDLNWLTNGADVGGSSEAGPYHTLTIDSPEAIYGTVEVYNGDKRVASGRKIAEGTELRVVAEPAYYYMLSTIKVNGEALSLNGNEATFVMTEDAVVTVEFERDPDIAMQYCIPTGTPSGARYISQFTVSDNNGTSIQIQGNGAGNGYTNRNTSVFNTTPGSTVTVNIEGDGSWQQTYLHIDYGRDGSFDADPSMKVANGDLVSHNGYRAGGSYFYDSKGSYVGNGSNGVGGDLPTFTIPADLPSGDYQARLRLAWDNIDACLDLTDVGTETGRACIDFMIHVQGPAHTVSAITQGRGAVEFWTGKTVDNTPTGVQIENGGLVDNGSETFVFFKPDEEDGARAKIQSIVVAYGDASGDDLTEVILVNLNNQGDYFYQLDSDNESDVVVATTFSNEIQAIQLIFGENDDDQPVDIFNLQGIKIETTEDLIPGIYIIRRGDKTSKIIFRR